MSDIHKGVTEGESRDRSSVNVGDHVTKLVIENRPKNLSENVKRRLDLDLGQNKTADYSRINLTEIFAIFSCDAAQTITHWRVAKILDGIKFASQELKISDSDITPGEIETKIYKPLLDGKVEEKTWSITLDPNKPEEKCQASLADFAYLLDIVNTNRNLGVGKQDLNKVVSAYFKREPLVFEIPSKEEGKKQKIDLQDQMVNPRDDYKDFDKDIKSYLKHTEQTDIQIGLQQLDSWREGVDGHRELGGGAFAVQKADGSRVSFVALSGRMAAAVTLEDLQKGEKGGMMGQPQELGEMDEAATGAIVRFRLADLAQRRKGGDVRNTGKTARLAKAMLGITLKEDALSQVKTTIKENGEQKSVIHLCGEKLDGQIIKGMFSHYNKAMMATRGYELTKEEASDLAFTDVFAPCIVNNENDWLTALASTYQIGGARGAFSLVQNKEKFQDFELVITCRDVDDEPEMPIKEMRFTGMGGLRTYLSKRIQKGHIDQPGVERFAQSAAIKDNAKADKGENEFFKDKISDQQGKKIGELIQYVLGEYTPDYLRRYIAKGSEKATFLTVYDKDGKLIPRGETAEGQHVTTFPGVLSKACGELRKRNDVKLEQLLEEIYDVDFTPEENVDQDIVVAGLISTLDNLADAERKKIV